MDKWNKIASTDIVDNKWCKLRKDEVELPNGLRLNDYYVFEKRSAAIIAAIDNDNNIIIKKEYRYPIDQFLYELPGGTIEGEEDPLETAKRELLEETGYEAKEWKLLAQNYDYPTKDTNCISIYMAKDIKKVASQHLDVSEEIEVEVIPFSKAVSMCINGDIKVNGSVAGILLAQLEMSNN